MVLIWLLTGCSAQIDELRSSYAPRSAREAYVLGLEETGISNSEMASRWLRQGEEVLASPVVPSLPYLEEGLLNPTQIMAVGYQLSLKKGQHLIVDARLQGSSLLFLDLYDQTGSGFRRVVSADSTFLLRYDINKSSTYVLRLQPEILAEGLFTLSIKVEASIIFPVSGRGVTDIGSRFGVERDGGRRRHHGVDIFANRGTPVIAVRKGFISSTRIGGLGGKTVWLRDQSGNNFYYAHLDSQMVREGQRVVPGDTLGLVGNTGNARTTPPHLHFGEYDRGPHDPWHFLYMPPGRPSDLNADPTRFGTSVFVEQALRLQPSEKADMIGPDFTPLNGIVIGATGSFYHIRLEDKTEGYIHKSFVATASP